jgi:hypothetical protein
MDGSVTYAATALGNYRVVNVETTRGMIDTTVKGDKHTQMAAGVVTHKITFAGLLDYVTGQKAVIDFLEAATPDITAGTLVFTVSSGKTWTWTSGAIITGYRITSPEGDNPVSFEADFHLNVQATISWA